MDIKNGNETSPLNTIVSGQNVDATIISLRVEKGLNQFELAEATGFSQAYISQIESGERKMTEQAAKKFSEFFCLEVGELLNSGYRNYMLRKINAAISRLPIDEVECLDEYIEFLEWRNR